MVTEDPFEQLFGIEDEFYRQGFEQGLADGIRQSRVEARLFGIEKGYEKFLEMGKIQTRAKAWQERIQPDIKRKSPLGATGASETVTSNARLLKHIDILVALVDTNTLSLSNDDDAVADFDDRLKRAQAKVTVIERMLGELDPLQRPVRSKTSAAANIEDFGM